VTDNRPAVYTETVALQGLLSAMEALGAGTRGRVTAPWAPQCAEDAGVEAGGVATYNSS